MEIRDELPFAEASLPNGSNRSRLRLAGEAEARSVVSGLPMQGRLNSLARLRVENWEGDGKDAWMLVPMVGLCFMMIVDGIMESL